MRIIIYFDDLYSENFICSCVMANCILFGNGRLYISFYEPSTSTMPNLLCQKKKGIDFCLNSTLSLYYTSFTFFSNNKFVLKNATYLVAQRRNFQMQAPCIRGILTLCAHVFANDLLPTINARYGIPRREIVSPTAWLDV